MFIYEKVMGNIRADRVAASEGDYGVYTKACKVAKKSKDPSVVFNVLALIRRNDNIIGTSLLYGPYWPKITKVYDFTRIVNGETYYYYFIDGSFEN